MLYKNNWLPPCVNPRQPVPPAHLWQRVSPISPWALRSLPSLPAPLPLSPLLFVSPVPALFPIPPVLAPFPVPPVPTSFSVPLLPAVCPLIWILVLFIRILILRNVLGCVRTLSILYEEDSLGFL